MKAAQDDTAPYFPDEDPGVQVMPLPELFELLKTDGGGLTSREAATRLAALGANELPTYHTVPLYLRFLYQFRNFFSLLLMFGALLACIAEWLDPGQGNGYIAGALVGVTFLNAVFTFIQEYQSERIMESFRRMLPSRVTVLRDGEPAVLDASELVPGDIIQLAEGDRVPADGRLLDASGLRIDLSTLTGESKPVLLDPADRNGNVLQSRNMVFSGSLVEKGTGSALVCHTGTRTQMGRIVELMGEVESADTPIRSELKHFIRVISTIAIILGILFFAVSVLTGKGAIGSLIFAIGIIVANVPEGLLPTVTLALTMASKRMARRNALIKNLESVETLGSTTVICTDKTGTLTHNRITVTSLYIDGQLLEANGEQTPPSPSLAHAARTMRLCNNARLDSKAASGDATEIALLRLAEALPADPDSRPLRRTAEEAFDSATRFMATLHTEADSGVQEAQLKGAPEVVLQMCTQIRRNGEILPLDEVARREFVAAYETLARQGERCLALASREASGTQIPDHGYILSALVGMTDPPREEVPDAIHKCRSAGIRVIMLTGDYGLTAGSIGREIGLLRDGGRIIEGQELAAMDATALGEALRAEELIFARISPMQKLQIVKALREQGEIVTVTGDGVNDAPALKHADMGVAMGIMGTDVAREAGDMVLMDDNFATIVAAVEEGRTIFENIKKFVAYILTSNVPEITPFIAYVLLDIPLPLTVVLILAIDLGTDILPALGLGAEPPESDVMHKPPRSRRERLLTPNMLIMSYGIVGMLQAAAGFFSYFTVLVHGGWQWGQALATEDPLYRTAITAFFASIIICQVADVIICRTRRQSLFTVGMFSNRLVLLGIGAELLLLGIISYVPACNTFFNTAPLETWHLLLSVPFALLILLGDELRRLLVRRDNPFVLRWLTW